MRLSGPGFLWKRASRNRNRAEFHQQFRPPRHLRSLRRADGNKPSHLDFEQFHSFKQASRHAIEGLGQLRDFVFAGYGELAYF